MEDGTPGPLAFDGSTMRPRPLPDRNSIRSPSCSSSLSPTSSAKVTFLRLVKEGLSSTIFLVRGWSVIESDFLELSSNPSNGNDAISRLSRLDGPAPTEDELKDRRTGVKSLGTSKGECRRNEKTDGGGVNVCDCVVLGGGVFLVKIEIGAPSSLELPSTSVRTRNEFFVVDGNNESRNPRCEIWLLESSVMLFLNGALAFFVLNWFAEPGSAGKGFSLFSSIREKFIIALVFLLRSL